MPIPPILIKLAEMAATIFVSETASRIAEEFTKADTEPSNEEIQKRWQQFLDELRRKFEATKKQLKETEEQLKEERQKRERQIVVAGVLCLILGGLVSSSVTWYFLQPGQHSEHIISLEELERYEKARDAGLQALEDYVAQNPNSSYIERYEKLRDAGLQALEDYVAQNPNSPYISQAKDQIRVYNGEE